MMLLNGTQLECNGEELRPDGTCAKCERINARIATLVSHQHSAPASPAALGGEAECYWCKHPDHGDKVCPVPYLARGKGGLAGSYPCGCAHSTVITTTPPSTPAKAAAEECEALITCLLSDDEKESTRQKFTAIIERCLSGGGEDK